MRPVPIYQRSKNVRTWVKDQWIDVEAYFEDAVHFIRLQLKVEKTSLQIEAIEIAYIRAPYPDLCRKVTENYTALLGVAVQKGFTKKIDELVPNNLGCVHVKSLLKEAADAVMQTGFHELGGNLSGNERRKVLIARLRNICYVYSSACD